MGSTLVGFQLMGDDMILSITEGPCHKTFDGRN